MIIAIDIGTTNMKAACVKEAGLIAYTAIKPNQTFRDPSGFIYYDPNKLWSSIVELITEAVTGAGNPTICAISITSMAESGLLVERSSGAPLTRIIPWFEQCSVLQAEFVEREIDRFEQFCRTGLYPSYKHGLAKLLWLKEVMNGLPAGCVWLSVSAYIAYRLTGRFAEDVTLAARTYAFRIDNRDWDAHLISHLGINPNIFPNVISPGEPMGSLTGGVASSLGLQKGTAVCLAGHDHVCASVAVGAVRAGEVYNSIGTAETMVGTMDVRPLVRADFESGLTYGLHAVGGLMFWMGGHSSSGGSVEWLRSQLGSKKLSYEDVLSLLSEADRDPTGILFYPYLTGSGAPYHDPHAKAAFIGLKSSHGKHDLLKAVLEGNAYQMEAIRRCAESVTGIPIRRMNAVGGGVHNPFWMQVKSDVSGVEFNVPAIAEATLLGAAICGGVGIGLYGSYAEVSDQLQMAVVSKYEPNAERHHAYQAIYEHTFNQIRRMLAGALINN